MAQHRSFQPKSAWILSKILANQGRHWRSLGRWASGAIALVGCLGLGSSAVRAGSAEPWHPLPDYTAMTILVDTSAATWSQLSQFQLFKLLEESLGVIPQPLGLPLLPQGLDFATQIQPWVGDTVVVALLPAEPGAAAAFADHLVMVAPIVDAAAFEAQRAAILALPGGDPMVQEIEGTTIYVWEPMAFEDWGEESWGEEDWGEESWDEEDGQSDLDGPVLDESRLDPARPASWSSVRRPSLSFVAGGWLPLTLSPKEGNEGGDDGDDGDDWGDEFGPFELDLPLPMPTFMARGLALAILPDTLVAAETPEAIQQYLTYRREFGPQGDAAGEEPGTATPSLATSREFQRTLAHRTETRSLVAVYANALEMLNYDLEVGDMGDGGESLIPPDLIQSLQAINFGGTLEALIHSTPHGIQFRGRYYYDAVPFTLGLTPTLADADLPLHLLPASTLVMASGRNLAGWWQGLTLALDQMGAETRDGLDAVRAAFTAMTGLDLDRDVVRWMDGEFAIAAFPHDGNALLPMGVGLLLQTSDRPAAETALAALDSTMALWETPVVDRTVNQQPVVSWEMYPLLEEEAALAPFASLLAHGWATDNTLAIVSGVGPISRLINPTPHDALADFFLFRQATTAFPRPNNGYFYLNMGATLSQIYPVLDEFGLGMFLDDFKPALGSVRSLSATTAQTPRHLEITGQLGLAQRRDP